MKRLILALWMCVGVLGISWTQQSIYELAERYANQRNQQGLTVGWINGESSGQQGFGDIGDGSRMAPRATHQFRIGACTQAFIAIWALEMENDGLFDLQDMVQDHLPSEIILPKWQTQRCVEMIIREEGKPQRVTMCTPDPLSDPTCLTFCDLLTHTSGLPITLIDNYDWHPFYQGLQMRDDFQDVEPREFFQLLERAKLKHRPGSEFLYSNAGLALLGQSIAQIYGLPFEALMQSILLGPMDLKETGFTPKNAIAPPFSRRGKQLPVMEFRSMAPAGGLYTTSTDLLRFLRLQLDPPRRWRNIFIAARQERIELTDPRQQETMVSYGWWVSYTGQYGNIPIYWQYGGTPGYRAFLAFCPEYNTGLTLLSNSPGPLKELGFSMLQEMHKQK